MFKFFCSEKNLGQKKNSEQKVWVQKKIPKKNLGQKKIPEKKCGSKKKFRKKFWVKKKNSEIFFGSTIFFLKKNVGQIFFGMDHLVWLNLGCIPKISFLGTVEVVKICRNTWVLLGFLGFIKTDNTAWLWP